MEINHLLKDVISLNEYITATHDVLNKYKNLKVIINIATVLTLKKIRSLEIEYLNKCDENGVACVIFERLLATPPSKVWGVLAKDLVYLLQYWLDAIRKHLIYHSHHWWMFLKIILKFIKELRLKDPSIPNMLVELTAECLFDLAAAPKPDVFQRHEILHCLNMVSAESGREVRFAMRIKFGDYFVKLALLMATSGYLPCQYSSIECLLRWLVPRQERSLRSAAADKWFPRDLFPTTARNLFLNSNWMNFFQDARNFLNALNESNGLITSVICRRLTIGEVVLINGTERQQTWLDFNTSAKSISVLLDPKVLGLFGVADHRAFETLHIDEDITEIALLRRESLGLTISLNTLRAPYIRPTDISMGDRCLVNIVISSQANLRTLDEAMRSTFGGKYQLLLDLDIDMTQSPQRSYNKNKNEYTSEEDTRFSHPVEVKRRKHSGYIVRNQNTGTSISPSTASTSSLIQLKDRLAALPLYKFNKELVSVCAQPALSNVTELTEQDDRSIYTTTTNKFQPYGVQTSKNFRTNDQKTPAEKKWKSEGETVRKKSRGGRRLLSPVVSDDNSTSLLLVATVGSTSDSVINETIEKLSKSKDFDEDNIINQLVQEAFQGNPKSREVSDRGINTDEKKSQEDIEAIDDTPKDIKEARSRVKKNCTIVSKSTTDDESNTEAINDTPAFVSTRKNIRSFGKPKTTVKDEKQTYHVKAVEEFFSQHIVENERGEIVISPTLSKKINETSSETSYKFDDNCLRNLLMNEDANTDIEQAIFNDIAAADCMNDMVDKVCSDFDKCTEYLHKENVNAGSNDTVNEYETSINKGVSYQSPISKPLEIQKPKRIMKLKYKPVKKPKARAIKKTKNVEQETNKKMSIILEQKEDDTFEEINPKDDNDKLEEKKPSPVKKSVTPPVMNTETPLVRKKRKLYSPKDDDVEKELQVLTFGKTSDDVPLSEMKTLKNTKTTALCYKELEKERKKFTRLPRSRRSKAKVIEMPSPRTQKINSMFDNLKQTVESGEKITLVDKTKDVYNFTSDSDDDDFKMKIDLKKRVSIAVESAKGKKRNTRRGKESESSYEESKAKTVKRKKVTKRNVKQNPEAKEPVVDLVDIVSLVDERMREAVREELNTSIIIEHPRNLEPTEIVPTLKKVPQMEEIYDSVSNDTPKKNIKKTLTERVNDCESNDTLAPKKRPYKITKKTQGEHDDTSNDTMAVKKRVKKRVNKKSELLLIKKEKELAKDKKAIKYVLEDDGTISPLPGLVVESTSKYKEDVNDSLTTNMLQKFKRIYKDGPDVINDSVNTQNMLSDVERFNISAQNYVNIADEIYFEDSNKKNVYTKIERDKCRKDQKPVLPKTTKDPRKRITTKKDNEIIEIHDVNDDQLDKSIASDDINAHGDIDELPPNPETIKEVLQPREIQDLDQSMKNYFIKLTREIHNSTSKDRNSSKSPEGEELCAISRNKTEKSAISPVVSVKQLSFEDISRWMPSRRTSDTDSPTSSKIRSQNKHNKHSSNVRSQNEDVESTPRSTVPTRKPQDTSTPESNKTKSPIVRIARISFDEFEKWLPMPKSFTKDDNSTSLHKDEAEEPKVVNKTRSKSKVKNTIATTKKAEEKQTGERTKETNSDSDEPISKCRAQIKKLKTDDRYSDDTLKIKPVGKEITMSTDKRKEDNVSNMDHSSSDDECLKKIRSVFSKHNDNKKYSLRNTSRSNTELSLRSLKRKSSSPIISGRRCVEPKRRKIEVLEDVILNESGPSVSSVNDWFRRTEPIIRRGDNPSMIYKDTIQDIMEKVDTTLVESNQNTSKKFVNLCVEVQKNLSDLKEERRQIYKHTATKLIGDMVRIMDETFADLNRKSQAMDDDFMEKFKKQTFELIQEDCKQKRAMVLLLKEDLQAVNDHIDSRNHSS